MLVASTPSGVVRAVVFFRLVRLAWRAATRPWPSSLRASDTLRLSCTVDLHLEAQVKA